MINGNSTPAPQAQGGQFAPRANAQQFGVPGGQVGQVWSQTGAPQPMHNPNQQIGNQGGGSVGADPTPIPFPPGQPPQTQVFLQDFLQQNIGRFVGVTAKFTDATMEFNGVISEVGTDFVILHSPLLGMVTALPTLFISFVQIPVAPVPLELPPSQQLLTPVNQGV